MPKGASVSMSLSMLDEINLSESEQKEFETKNINESESESENENENENCNIVKEFPESSNLSTSTSSNSKFSTNVSSKSLLLRLFQSDLFTAVQALHYLQKYSNEPGIQYYLCERLKELPDEDVEIFLPQLWYHYFVYV